MITLFAIRKIAVHNRNRITTLRRCSSRNQPALCIFLVTRQPLDHIGKRTLRHNGNAIMSFLTMVLNAIAKVLNNLNWKILISNLGFLQPDNIRLMFLNKRLNLMKPKSQAIDVK